MNSRQDDKKEEWKDGGGPLHQDLRCSLLRIKPYGLQIFP